MNATKALLFSAAGWFESHLKKVKGKLKSLTLNLMPGIEINRFLLTDNFSIFHDPNKVENDPWILVAIWKQEFISLLR